MPNTSNLALRIPLLASAWKRQDAFKRKDTYTWFSSYHQKCGFWIYPIKLLIPHLQQCTSRTFTVTIQNQKKMFFCNLFIMLHFWNPYSDHTSPHVLSIGFGCQSKPSGNSESKYAWRRKPFQMWALSLLLSLENNINGSWALRGMVRRSQRETLLKLSIENFIFHPE